MALRDSEIVERLCDRSVIPSEVIVANVKYRIEGASAIDSGLYSAVWKAKDHYGRDRALKFKVHKQKRNVLESAKASALEGCTQFARFVDTDTIWIEIRDAGNTQVDVFVEEWVEGVTLEDFTKHSLESVTPSLILGFVHEMCTALNALRELRLSHGDLHNRNILIANPPLGSFDDQYSIRVVDVGRLSEVSEDDLLKDHVSFVRNLVELWNALYSKRGVSRRDRRFLNFVVPLLNQMLEEDSGIALRDPRAISDRFQDAYSRAELPVQQMDVALPSPFDFISADQIFDARLLVKLFADSCPWIDKVSSPDPCLVTGPRGCGKSTIFRWLALRTRLEADPNLEIAEIKQFGIFGFYISCSADLQNRFSWAKEQDLAEKSQSFLVHYFNMICLREVVITLSLIAKRSDCSSFWGLNSKAESQILDFVVETLGRKTPIRFSGSRRIDQIVEIVEREIFEVHLQRSEWATKSFSTGAAFLGDLTTLLKSSINRFSSHQIAFLVDDYSVHRIPAPVQIILNQIIWERRSTHVFKLSSEKHGAILNDELLASSEISRERLEIDCGKEYLALDDYERQRQALQFARELLDNRLAVAEYAGRSETIIGESNWGEYGSLPKALQDTGKPRNNQYHGMQCIAQLCSGDISSLLMVYRAIFETGRVTKTTETVVSHTIQHQAIVKVSKSLLEVVRTYYPHGPKLYEIINAFGTLVRNILVEGQLQSDGTPTMCPRIEIDQVNQHAFDTLDENSVEIAWELVRRALFIEMESGLSRHGRVTTLRWQVRRVFLPAFHAALSKNDAVKRGPDWFQWFIDNPQEATKAEWKAWPKRNGPKRSAPDNTLFS